jgi:hypothetical protein
METLSHSPDVAKCNGCGVVCGVDGDFGLSGLCPACEQSLVELDAQRTIGDATAVILGRKPFDGLSVEDRQELLNHFFAGIGYVPQAVKANEAERWLNPPQPAKAPAPTPTPAPAPAPAARSAPGFRVHVRHAGMSVTHVFKTPERAKKEAHFWRTRGRQVRIDGQLL